MRRILHHRDDTAAVVGMRAFFNSRDWPYRQSGLDEGTERVVTDADRERELSFCQGICELAQVLIDEQVLLRQPRQKFFAFDFPEKRPGILSRAGIARIEHADPPFPFGIE